VQDEAVKAVKAVKANQELSRKRRNRVWCPSEVLVWSPTEVLQFSSFAQKCLSVFCFVLTSKNLLFVLFCPHSEANRSEGVGRARREKDLEKLNK
jgi:hypothetical protein